MLTNLEFRAPGPTGDQKKDYLQLVAAISAHFRKLNDKDVLLIQQGAIDSTPIGANDPSTGKFTTLESTGNTTLGNGSDDQVTVNADLVDFPTASTRIKADFSNATLGNRTYFQTRTSNAATDVGAIGDGSGTASAFSAYGGSVDPANAHILQLLAAGAATIIRSTSIGTGTQRALEQQIGSTTRFGIETDGRLYGTAMHNTGTVTGTAKNYLASGTYTPSTTNVANVTISGANVCRWKRVGNVVTVAGRLGLTPTAATTDTEIGVSLPIASSIANAFEVSGSGVAFLTGKANESIAIMGDAANDRATFKWYPPTTDARSFEFVFVYEIL